MSALQRIGFLWAILFALTLFHSSSTCWGPSSSKYGETTPDYDLLVGSELVIDCSLHSGILPKIDILANSSYLMFKKDSEQQLFYNNTHQVDDLTAQLRIPNANVNDSGLYHCTIALPDNTKHFVCSTNVYVGYPPKNVSNFKCISRNFDNLTCTWDIEPNNVRTNYSVQKIFLFQDTLQNCPKPNNNTFCQWREDTEPPYQTLNKNLTFRVHGNNSLGFIENEFKFDHFAIVIPNSPEKLSAEIGTQSFTLHWLPPTMSRILERPFLFYQLWLDELGPDPKSKIVIDVGVEKFNFTFNNLLPHFKYSVSVRCRTNHSSEDDMWSPLVSVIVKTYPDVPYILPKVNTNAFLIQNFGNYRNATLYWKPVSKRFFNGEDFHYYIECYQNEPSGKTHIEYVTSYTPSVKIGLLQNDSSYSFHIHSANKEGISVGYEIIVIDERNKIEPAPKDIRAVSHELGYYNLSWSNIDVSDANYTVFWCAGRKPSYCDGPIQWSETIFKVSTFAVEVTDVMLNFQFAVAATNKGQSSGMQWASCIVPSKAPLGQIPITHIEPFSTALRVMWKLDCDAQKSVIDRYVITYCREGRSCEDAIAESDAQSYTLKNLHPFSNYSIKLRAFNKDNKPSEDVDEIYQATLSGDPSDSPQNVSVFSRSNSTLGVKWTPPHEPNGIITHYYIYHNELRQFMKDSFSCKICSFIITNLDQYENYDISVQACVGDHCSKKSEIVRALTDVGAPGKMVPPRVEYANETHFLVLWTSPSTPNGPISFYELLWHQEMGNETTNRTISINEGLSTFIDFECPNLLKGGINYLLYVRAVNERNGTFLYGPFSDSAKATACIMSQGLAMIIGIAIGGTLALAIFLFVIYKLVKWMSEKIHQVKNIAVRLPKELEGPETNPLNNYESFKKGLAQSTHNGKIDHQSYVIDENDSKNRHGSGNSQFSNASTDELIFKNGKCTKFGRKPSGDSSGCSSMSSNTTTRMHLSSDSGTESDFMVPASPDSLITDQSILNGQKPPMPILMEIHDLPEASCETQTKTPIHNKLDKHNSFNSGMVLKVDHAYSKFGITGSMTSNLPYPLAFYSCNLANSEPSVFEAPSLEKQKISAIPPYSKVGLAKSSGDILSIGARNEEMGYSKFGFGSPTNCFSVDYEKLNLPLPQQKITSIDNEKMNHIVGLAFVDNSEPNKSVITEKGFDQTDFHAMLPFSSTDFNTFKNITCSVSSLSENLSPQKPNPGYVAVGDMRSIKRPDNLSISESSLNIETSSPHSPENLSIDFSCINPEWGNNIICPKETKFDDLSFLDPNSVNEPLISDQTDSTLNGKFASTPNNGCIQVVPAKESILDVNDLSLRLDNFTNTQENPSNELSSPCKETVVSLHPTHSSRSVEGEQNSDKQPLSSEVVLTPITERNGYVPFSILSSVCDPQISIVPNATETNIPLSVFPDDVCTDIDQNYITPSNKSDLKLLQDGLVTKNKNFSPLLHCNGKKMHKISKPLKYILKPLPKMESEICEV